jgi:hypothetical protein
MLAVPGQNALVPRTEERKKKQVKTWTASKEIFGETTDIQTILHGKQKLKRDDDYRNVENWIMPRREGRLFPL